jgi:fatty acid desaturase
MSRIIRYPIDVVSVGVVLCALALQVTALARGWPWYLVFPIFFLLREVNLIEHNHMHLAIFRHRFLNVLLGWMCHLSGGVPLDSYRLHHVVNHHRYNNRFDAEGRDWSSLFGFRGTRFPDRPVGKAYYVLSFPFLAHGETLLWFLRSPTSKTTRGFVVSMAVVGPVSLFLAWLSPAGFVMFFVLPWIAILFGMGNNNYDHHDGCEMTGTYNAANSFLTFYYTVLSFNVGYHLAHHHKPNLHWSLLPNCHEALMRSRPDTGVPPRPAYGASATPTATAYAAARTHIAEPRRP